MSPRTTSAPAKEVSAQACCRVDLAGATLDLWPLYLFHENAVTVNFGVKIMTSCRITARKDSRIVLRSRDLGRHEEFEHLEALCGAKKCSHPLPAHLVRFFLPSGGLTIETHSESPAGAGISGSSALMIATTAALARYTNRKLTPEEMRVLAQNVEAQLIRVPTGCQDYYPALYGGVNAIELRPEGIRRVGITVPPEEIEKRFVLVYTGVPRQSGINNWEVFKAHINGDKKVQRNFERIAQIAHAMQAAVAAQAWDDVARLLNEEWKQRRANAPTISTPLIDKLVTVSKRNGGRAAKVCGAGGGGCAIFFVEEGSRERVSRALAEAGGTVLPLQVARKGVEVTG